VRAARRASNEDKAALIDKVEAFIFDCDGVIWRGDSVIEGVPETLEYLRSKVCVLRCARLLQPAAVLPTRARSMGSTAPRVSRPARVPTPGHW
jgi:hypothetical protein